MYDFLVYSQMPVLVFTTLATMHLMSETVCVMSQPWHEMQSHARWIRHSHWIQTVLQMHPHTDKTQTQRELPCAVASFLCNTMQLLCDSSPSFAYSIAHARGCSLETQLRLTQSWGMCVCAFHMYVQVSVSDGCSHPRLQHSQLNQLSH